MFGKWGKPRSRFGKFIDDNDLSQEQIRAASKVNRDTISRVCNDGEYLPSGRTMKQLLDAIKKLTGKNVNSNDFWM